jgi:hypothetical protein
MEVTFLQQPAVPANMTTNSGPYTPDRYRLEVDTISKRKTSWSQISGEGTATSQNTLTKSLVLNLFRAPAISDRVIFTDVNTEKRRRRNQ